MRGGQATIWQQEHRWVQAQSAVLNAALKSQKGDKPMCEWPLSISGNVRWLFGVPYGGEIRRQV